MIKPKYFLSLTLCLIATLTIAQPETREQIPVVLEGGELEALINLPTDQIVGFRFIDDEWDQIPVQVDQRVVRTGYELYNGMVNDFYDQSFLVYADANTFTGADENDLFDPDDELVFMAKDAGIETTMTNFPAGTLGFPVQVRVYDPAFEKESYVYLFEQDGSLDPSAGEDYVDYTYQLLAGDDFEDAYVINDANPENSIISTPYYVQRYRDDWIKDVLKITAGNSLGNDILDQDKLLLEPGVCYRNVETYSLSRGIHIASTDGPVRAIRQWMGANSGPLMQRTHVFYEQAEYMTFNWRVHFLRGMLKFLDLNTNALDMTYYNSNLPNGVKIDGQPDQLEGPAPKWHLYSGDQGSLMVFDQIQASFPVDTFLIYQQDDQTPPDQQCSGDDFSIGASGFWLKQQLPNTDPRETPYEVYTMNQTYFFLEENNTPSEVEYLVEYVRTPLDVEIEEMATSVDNIIRGSEIKVHPNPTDKYLMVRLPVLSDIADVRILTINGQEVWKGQMEGSAATLVLPDGLTGGLYILEVQTREQIGSTKFLVR